MKTSSVILSIILGGFLLSCSMLAQPNTPLAENAALRYWSAFSEIRDSGITDQQAKELNSILDGTAPYDDLKYGGLVGKNSLALQIMARATTLPQCDWGLDYDLGHDIPVEYARKALLLGRLNVLYTFHLLKTGDKDGAVRALVTGLRFSRDVGNGGSLFATLIAKDLLTGHLRAVAGALHLEKLTPIQQTQLRTAVTRAGEGLDWSMAARRDLAALRRDYSGNPRTSAALTEIISAYVAALKDPSKLPALNHLLQSAPQELANRIPDAKRVLEQEQDLNSTIWQVRSLLR
jgi:hypothetical protein